MKKYLVLLGLLFVGCSAKEADFALVKENMNNLEQYQMNGQIVITGEGNSNDNIMIERKSNGVNHEVYFDNDELDGSTVKFTENGTGLNLVELGVDGTYTYVSVDEVFYGINYDGLFDLEYVRDGDVYTFTINEEMFNDLVDEGIFFPTGDVEVKVTVIDNYVTKLELNDSFVYHEKNVNIHYMFEYSKMNENIEIIIPEDGTVNPEYEKLEDVMFEIENYVFDIQFQCEDFALESSTDSSVAVCPMGALDLSIFRGLELPEGVLVDGELLLTETGINGKFKYNDFDIEVVDSRVERQFEF